MSRLEETETEIADLDDSYSARTYTDSYAELARTIADEVDARDAVITKLLAMLEPGKPPCDCITEIGPRCSCMNQGDAANAESWWTTMCHYRRACEIAGRTE